MADLELDRLIPTERKGNLSAPFEPCAKYFAGPDILVYLEEDVSYRADRVDPFLTLLWHPSKEEAIGVKLKGFRFLFGRMRAIMRSQGKDLGDSEFYYLVSALEVAMTAGLGAALTVEAEQERIRERQERIREKYERARRLLEKAAPRFRAAELARAA